MQITYRRRKLHAGGSLRSLRLLESAVAAALVGELPVHEGRLRTRERARSGRGAALLSARRPWGR